MVNWTKNQVQWNLNQNKMILIQNAFETTKYQTFCSGLILLTHWGRVTHICVCKLTIIGSENGLSPGRRQAIIWTNDGILIIGSPETNFSEILSKIQTFSLTEIRLKMLSAICGPFHLSLNVLTWNITPEKIRTLYLVMCRMSRTWWLNVYSLNYFYLQFKHIINQW